MTRNENLDHDLETNPLKILTNSTRVSQKIHLQMVDAGTITIYIQSEQYYIPSCNDGIWSKLNNLPAAVNKDWIFTKTKEALTILCNGVEVVNLVYAEVHNYCTKIWSRNVTKIRFMSDDTASDFWRSVIRGNILILKFKKHGHW